MRKLLALSVLVLLACCSVPMKPKPGETAPAEGQVPPAPPHGQTAAAAVTGQTFVGTIVGYRMGGSMARPYVRAKIKGEDGQVVEFNLRKTTAVTDPDGNAIGYTKRFKNGRRVEITFNVTNGLNEAIAWHYLD